MSLGKIFDLNFEYKDNTNNFFVNDRYRFEKTLRTLIFSRIINKSRKFRPYIVTDKATYSNDLLIKSSKIKFLSIKGINFFKKIFIYIKIFVELNKFYTKIFFRKDKVKWLINEYELENIKIGDLIYDYYIRYENRYIKPSFFSFNFLKIIIEAIYKIKVISFFVKKYNPKLIISTSKGYTSIGNLLTRLCTKKKIKVISTGYNYIYLYKSYKDSFSSIWKIDDYKLETLKKILKKKNIRSFVEKRLLGKISGSYVNKKTLNKAYINKNDTNFLNLINTKKKENKKIILFATHCFSDAPHHAGNLIFNDYYDQFISTLNFIRDNNLNNYYWIIKPHPARNNYGENGVIENHLKKLNLGNTIMCSNKMSNSVLLKNINYLITTNSTIALEYACLGKKAILGGDAPYYFPGIFFKPKSPKQYFFNIKNLNKKNTTLNSAQISKAKKVLYTLENFTNISLPSSKFIPNEVINRNLNNKSVYEKALKLNFKNNLDKLNSINFKKELFYKESKKKLLEIVSDI